MTTADIELEGAQPGQRQFPELWRWVLIGLSAVISLVHIWANTYGLFAELTRNALHFASFGVLCALYVPMLHTDREGRRRAVLWIDLAIAALVIVCVAYVLIRERALSGRSFTSDWDYVVFITLVVMVIEFTRRTTGIVIPIIILTALGYIAWWGRYVPGSLGFTGLSLETVLQRAVYGEDGLFGTIASISSSFVFLFILFGAFLVKSGAGNFIIDLARAMAGRLTGGPGFVAVIASGLTGTISGSAVANTVSTGVITIPLMKRSGFPPHFAAGVEAAASTGGQLMPPIMGAGAFVMANLTEIPYFDIVAVAFLPAVMYFLGIGFNVRIMARKHNLRPVDEDVPSVWQVLKGGGLAFLLPIGVLIGLLIAGFTPTYAACFAIVAVIASSWLTPIKMGPRLVLEALALGARNMILTAILLVAVGLVMMTITGTGVGNTFSLMIADWAGGNLLLAIVLVGIASLVLGMGLPVTAAYIVLATLSAPALNPLIVQSGLADALTGAAAPQALSTVFLLFTPDLLVSTAQTNGLAITLDQAQALADAAMAGQVLTAEQARLVVDIIAMPEVASLAGSVQDAVLSPVYLTTALLSAHMIIFWLSQDSNVTPPVCLTAFAAAAIARTKPMVTGLTAWKVAKTLYIVPLLFAYTPLLSGDITEVVPIFLFGTLGIYAVIGAIEGHLEAPLNWPLRGVLAAVGVALLWPGDHIINIVGAVLVIGILVWTVRRGRLAAAPGEG